ncbi:MAG: molybdopterin cofactor-binding domain-containing protein [Xanthobacteraceae bacterium]
MSVAENLAKYPGVDDWIEIAPHGRITVHTGKADIGQRISTALALIAAEELDVDYERIDAAGVDTASSPDEEYTSASNSVERSGATIKLASATARRHLLDLAAQTLGVDANTLQVSDGLVRSSVSNRSVTYWELMEGRRFTAAVITDIACKPPQDYRQIGRRVVAKDLADLVRGTAPFVHDLRLPGMLHARLVRPPHYHARIEEIDRTIFNRLDGAHLVRDGSFVAVAADDEYRAIQIAERVTGAIRWLPRHGLDATDVFTRLKREPRVSLPVRNGDAYNEPVPPLEPPPAQAVTTVNTRIERPYTMHGSIGPSAAMALLQNGDLTIWTHTQGVYPLRLTIAECLDMDPGRVRLVQKRGPGAYGHNGADDAALEAALIARALPGKPVLLKWSRADEHAWEPYGPAMVVEIRASLDGSGHVVDWSHETWSDTHRTRPRPGPGQIGPARMISTRLLSIPVKPFVAEPFLSAPLAGIHRNAFPYYSFPRPRVVKHLVRDMPLRTSTLRSLGTYANVIAIETTMDELARAAKIDALEFRLRHLIDERAHAVLNAAAERAQWGRANPRADTGRGLAFARYNNLKAYAAVIVDLRVDDAAKVHLDRIVIAADAGQIVDHDGLALQLEGAALQSASWTLYEQVTFDASGITSRDWDSYPMLRFDNVPDVVTALIDRPGMPYLGPSECAIGPTAAAIANAIHDATGLRLNRLPFTPDAIRQAALQ